VPHTRIANAVRTWWKGNAASRCLSKFAVRLGQAGCTVWPAYNVYVTDSELATKTEYTCCWKLK
jgi:hypothetical protein